MNCAILADLPRQVILRNPHKFGDWEVSKHGLENTRYSFYDIPAARLGEAWLPHMSEKTWVNTSDFGRALAAARIYHLSLPTGVSEMPIGENS